MANNASTKAPISPRKNANSLGAAFHIGDKVLQYTMSNPNPNPNIYFLYIREETSPAFFKMDILAIY
jgi:hypothetical protein